MRLILIIALMIAQEVMNMGVDTGWKDLHTDNKPAPVEWKPQAGGDEEQEKKAQAVTYTPTPAPTQQQRQPLTPAMATPGGWNFGGGQQPQGDWLMTTQGWVPSKESFSPSPTQKSWTQQEEFWWAQPENLIPRDGEPTPYPIEPTPQPAPEQPTPEPVTYSPTAYPQITGYDMLREGGAPTWQNPGVNPLAWNAPLSAIPEFTYAGGGTMGAGDAPPPLFGDPTGQTQPQTQPPATYPGGINPVNAPVTTPAPLSATSDPGKQLPYKQGGYDFGQVVDPSKTGKVVWNGRNWEVQGGNANDVYTTGYSYNQGGYTPKFAQNSPTVAGYYSIWDGQKYRYYPINLTKAAQPRSYGGGGGGARRSYGGGGGGGGYAGNNTPAWMLGMMNWNF